MPFSFKLLHIVFEFSKAKFATNQLKQGCEISTIFAIIYSISQAMIKHV